MSFAVWKVDTETNELVCPDCGARWPNKGKSILEIQKHSEEHLS